MAILRSKDKLKKLASALTPDAFAGFIPLVHYYIDKLTDDEADRIFRRIKEVLNEL